MINAHDEIVDVLVVGAGPSGLTMANFLASQGINFRIIDRKKEPTSYSGAMFVQARTLEVLEQLSLANKALKKGTVVKYISFYNNGKRIFRVKTDMMGEGLSKFPFILMLKQNYMEKLLLANLSEKGVMMETETELISFEQHTGFISARVQLPDGENSTYKCRYLIGADGVHSTVRTNLRIPWKGKKNNRPLFVSDCMVTNKSNGIKDIEEGNPFTKAGSEVIFALSKTSIAGFFPLQDRQWRIDSVVPRHVLKNKQELSFQDMQGDFGKRIRLPLKLLDAQWFSTFKASTYLADTFYRNNCFLIGDAAHVHTPIGAQGMNTGMQDAYNLAWKLGFVIDQKSNDEILNTFEKERRPVAANLIKTTDRYFELAIRNDPLTKALRIFVFPLLMKAISHFLNRRSWQHSFFRKISEISINYRQTSKSYSSMGSSDIRAGDRLPYLEWLEESQRNDLHQLLSPVRYLLLVFVRDESDPEDFKRKVEREKGIMKTKYLHYLPHTKTLFETFKLNRGYLLVRPDGYIAVFSSSLDTGLLNRYWSGFR